jgi:ribosomal protein S18 acetylase RimI-like enzyme
LAFSTSNTAPSEIYLARIEIQPSHQGQGIGSRIMQDLLDQATIKGQPMVLDVLAVNQRAQALFQRLGFTDTTRHGINNIKIRMTTIPHLIHKS